MKLRRRKKNVNILDLNLFIFKGEKKDFSYVRSWKSEVNQMDGVVKFWGFSFEISYKSWSSALETDSQVHTLLIFNFFVYI